MCTDKSQNELYYSPFWLLSFMQPLKKYNPENTLSYPVISCKKKFSLKKKINKIQKEPFRRKKFRLSKCAQESLLPGLLP